MVIHRSLSDSKSRQVSRILNNQADLSILGGLDSSFYL